MTTGLPQPQNVPMEFVRDKERLASFLALEDAPTLAQVLLELAEDHAPVYARLERLRLRDDPAALSAQFTQQLRRWEADDRFVRYQDASAFGLELGVWVAQVQREVLPRFPGEAMALIAPSLSSTGWCLSGWMTTADPFLAPLSLHAGCG